MKDQDQFKKVADFIVSGTGGCIASGSNETIIFSSGDSKTVISINKKLSKTVQ